MSSQPLNPAALRAITAYANPASRPEPRAVPDSTTFQPAGRQVVRSVPGVSVELSADARAALIAVQSEASSVAGHAPSVLRQAPAQPEAAPRPPGGKLNLSI